MGIRGGNRKRVNKLGRNKASRMGEKIHKRKRKEAQKKKRKERTNIDFQLICKNVV